LSSGADVVVVVAIGLRAANEEEQDFGQRMSNAVSITWVVDDGEVSQQYAEA
jgi:hypothetical protein